MKRTVLSVASLVLLLSYAVDLAAQVRTVLVERSTHIFVTPYVRPEALALVEANVVLAVIQEQGDWYLIEYESARLGRRRGYVQKDAVRALTGAAPPQLGVPPTAALPVSPPARSAGSVTLPTTARPSDAKRERQAQAPKSDGPSKWRAFGEGLAIGLSALALGFAASQGGGGSTASAYSGAWSSSKLLLFGGRNHTTYLGCVNCDKYAVDSVSNNYGDHGSRYSQDSILNPYSDYGSRYSDYGACNPYAQDPPVIVDHSGAFYGRLTLNKYHHQRTADERLLAWLAGVCAH